MISIKKLAVTGAAAGLLLASAVPAFAHHSGVSVNQSNEADVNNHVTANSNTGGNQIKAYSGEGEVEWGKIKTGKATTGVDVSNAVNSNFASVDTCGCSGKKVKVSQSNEADVNNTVTANSNTGGNKIKGSSEVEWGKIKTGDAFTGVSVANLVNSNVATVGSTD